jgi:hypothetical protein
MLDFMTMYTTLNLVFYIFPRYSYRVARPDHGVIPILGLSKKTYLLVCFVNNRLFA